MISEQFTKSLPGSVVQNMSGVRAQATDDFSVDLLESIMSDAATKLVRRQLFIAQRRYLSRSGDLRRVLGASPFHVIRGSSTISLLISYPFYIRFLDLQKTTTGRNKKRYYPIYNRLIWGFMMGYTYGRLRRGLSGAVNNAFQLITNNIKITV